MGLVIGGVVTFAAYVVIVVGVVRAAHDLRTIRSEWRAIRDEWRKG